MNLSGITSNYQTFSLQEPQKEKKEKGTDTLFKEIIAESFPNLGRETDIQVQEAQRVSNKVNPNRPTPRYTVIKMAKVKETILKKIRVSYKRNPLRLSADVSSATLQTRREWKDIFKVLKERNPQLRIITQQDYHSEMKGTKSFPGQAETKGVHHH